MTTADSWNGCPHCDHFIDWHVGVPSKGRAVDTSLYRCFKCGCTISHRIELVKRGRAEGSSDDQSDTAVTSAAPQPENHSVVADRGTR